MKTKQLYLPDTNVLLTRFLSEDGVGEITDFMPVEELYNGKEFTHLGLISAAYNLDKQLNDSRNKNVYS